MSNKKLEFLNLDKNTTGDGNCPHDERCIAHVNINDYKCGVYGNLLNNITTTQPSDTFECLHYTGNSEGSFKKVYYGLEDSKGKTFIATNEKFVESNSKDYKREIINHMKVYLKNKDLVPRIYSANIYKYNNEKYLQMLMDNATDEGFKFLKDLSLFKEDKFHIFNKTDTSNLIYKIINKTIYERPRHKNVQKLNTQLMDIMNDNKYDEDYKLIKILFSIYKYNNNYSTEDIFLDILDTYIDSIEDVDLYGIATLFNNYGTSFTDTIYGFLRFDIYNHIYKCIIGEVDINDTKNIDNFFIGILFEFIDKLEKSVDTILLIRTNEDINKYTKNMCKLYTKGEQKLFILDIYYDIYEKYLISCGHTLEEIKQLPKIEQKIKDKYFSELIASWYSNTKNEIESLFKAINKIHKLNIIHHDLKYDNILYNKKTNKYKIIDFGLSFTIQEWCSNFKNFYSNEPFYIIEKEIYEYFSQFNDDGISNKLNGKDKTFWKYVFLMELRNLPNMVAGNNLTWNSLFLANTIYKSPVDNIFKDYKKNITLSKRKYYITLINDIINPFFNSLAELYSEVVTK